MTKRVLPLLLFCFLACHARGQEPTTGIATAAPSFDTAHVLSAGKTYRLSNVYFKADRHEIRKKESKQELQLLYAAMAKNPHLKITIEGHVCCIREAIDAFDAGTLEPTLSVNRAKAIYDYLISKGIAASRLAYTGKGHSMPIVPDEKSKADAALNRRVEIRVMEK